MEKVPPKEMADQIIRLLRKQRPDSNYLKKVFQYIREGLALKGGNVRSNRLSKFSTRWIREIVKKYAKKAGISKRIHPHLFRHQVLTYLTSKGIVDAKIQLISGHKNRESLSVYKDLSLTDIEKEYWNAMKDFPIQ